MSIPAPVALAATIIEVPTGRCADPDTLVTVAIAHRIPRCADQQ